MYCNVVLQCFCTYTTLISSLWWWWWWWWLGRSRWWTPVSTHCEHEFTIPMERSITALITRVWKKNYYYLKNTGKHWSNLFKFSGLPQPLVKNFVSSKLRYRWSSLLIFISQPNDAPSTDRINNIQHRKLLTSYCKNCMYVWNHAQKMPDLHSLITTTQYYYLFNVWRTLQARSSQTGLYL